uniref:Reverse transcriptase RNase H-like domain-containing protein n=1 Tax=Moniliophthora roreri TaxID=221103 RepID=A0A0W0FYS4_MONRR
MIETNTSNYAIAAILSITLSNSELYPVAFLSQTLTGAELNYDMHDKELLAIFEAFKSWCHYLEGATNPIDIVTDHKNLEYFSTTKILTQQQTLEQYLQMYCTYQQVNWDTLLPLAEFAYNNAPNASTGVSPFFTNKRYHPNITVHLEYHLASQKACNYVSNLNNVHQFLRDEIKAAQEAYKTMADN